MQLFKHSDLINKKNNQVFVLMPFCEEWSDRIWERHLKRIIVDFGLKIKRADDLYGPNILADILTGIYESRIILADITSKNPNVMYELGLCHALNKDVVILTQNLDDIPFDLKTSRCLLYKDNSDGYDRLENQLPKFLSDILSFTPKDNFGNTINDDDVVILYLSTGGTCRCAMANVITRELISKYSKIVPISAGLIEASTPYISKEAMEVLESKLNIKASNHKTIKADFPLLKRANIILPMENRLAEEIPSEFKSKVTLFREFFRKSGDVADPFNHGLNAYHECINLLFEDINPNIDVINALATE